MPVNRAWFSYQNLIKNAAVTADSEVALLPVTNVKDRLQYRIFRSQSENVVISIDFGSAVTWRCIVIGFPPNRDPNGSVRVISPSTDTILIDASNVSAGANELLAFSGAAQVNAVRGYYAYVANSDITGRYLDITIRASSLADLGYVDVGYLHVGACFFPSTNYNTGTTLDFPENSLINVASISGSQVVESRGRLLAFDGVWSLIQPAELAIWQDMQERVGITEPIAFGLTDNGNLSRAAFTARFESPLAFAIGQSGIASARVSLRENR